MAPISFPLLGSVLLRAYTGATVYSHASIPDQPHADSAGGVRNMLLLSHLDAMHVMCTSGDLHRSGAFLALLSFTSALRGPARTYCVRVSLRCHPVICIPMLIMNNTVKLILKNMIIIRRYGWIVGGQLITNSAAEMRISVAEQQ